MEGATLSGLREGALGCTRCPLSQTRTQVVFGDGPSNARLMLVGEAPGADEDRIGRPFQGVAGESLDRLMHEAGLDRANAYVANAVMCRPPGNRRPTGPEIKACAPFLDAQRRLIDPSVSVALGVTATRRLLGKRTTIKAVREQVHHTESGDVVATYHPSPSSLNRSRGRRTAVLADLELVRSTMEQAGKHGG